MSFALSEPVAPVTEPKPKAAPRRRCKSPKCKKWLKQERISAVTCGSTCERAYHRSRVAKAQFKFVDTAFGKWVIKQCQRAGTVEICTSTLIKTVETWKLQRSSNGVNDDTTTTQNRFECSHIAPVSGGVHSKAGVVGTIDFTNLVVTTGDYNRSRGTRWDSVSGHWLPVFGLQSKYKITSCMTPKTIVDLIADHLGPDFDTLLTTLKLAEDYRSKATRRLVSLNVGSASALSKLSYEAFRALDTEHKSIPGRADILESLTCLVGYDAKYPDDAALRAAPDAQIFASYREHFLNTFWKPRSAEYAVYCSSARAHKRPTQSSAYFADNTADCWEELHNVFVPAQLEVVPVVETLADIREDVSREFDAYREQQFTDSITYDGGSWSPWD
jgi:hypothetical protein